MSDQPLQPDDLNDYRAWLAMGKLPEAFDALLNHVSIMVGFKQIDTDRWTKFSQELHGLRQAVESDTSARMRQAEQIAEMQRTFARTMEWLNALDFDGQGAMVQSDAPPILRLLAELVTCSRTIIEQNALLIGAPSPAEAAALKDAQARQQVSLPSLLLQLAEMVTAIREVRRNQFALAAGLALMLLLLGLHSWQMAMSLSAALGWLVSGG